MEMKCDLTAEYVRSLLRYDRDQGRLFWLVDRGGNAKKGAETGKQLDEDKYPAVRIDDNLYLAHRLAWLIVTGEWPAVQIDHRDLIKTNYKFENLRPSTQAQNMQNSCTRSDNKSGHKGVSWDKINQMWVARIRETKGKYHNLGRFKSADDAADAYASKAFALYGEFARLS